jgi:hypothetical protein
MAVKRALVFRAGTRGLICAALEVAIDQGTEIRQGTMRGIGECTKPATVIVHNTGFCEEHGEQIARSRNVSVVDRIIRKGR